MPPAPGRCALALAVTGLPRDLPARTLIEHAASLGFRALQLDLTHPELRPRALSRSARKGLASLLRRAGLLCAGADLFIPPAHLTSPDHADHAFAAFALAIDFTAELAQLTESRPVLSTALPTERDAHHALEQLAEHADARGVRIADHTWTAQGHARAGASLDAPVGPGIDPASILLVGADPAKAVSSLSASAGPGIVAARLTDTDGASRIEPGAPGGRLDAFSYFIALHTAGHDQPLTLGLRGVSHPLVAAARARARFDTTP